LVTLAVCSNGTSQKMGTEEPVLGDSKNNFGSLIQFKIVVLILPNPA